MVMNAVSHDLRTPLNGIAQQIDWAWMAASFERPDIPQALEAMGKARRIVSSARDMVDGLLEAARADREDPKISTFPLANLIDHVVEMVSGLAPPKGIAVAVECPGDVLARTDRHFLKRAIGNLVDNAVKYTDCGRVIVRAGRTDEPGVFVEVEDTGRGISRADLDRLFHDFTQVGNPERDSAKGFGLGLANVRRLALRLGGKVVVDSEPGVGSVFRIDLPDLAPR